MLLLKIIKVDAVEQSSLCPPSTLFSSHSLFISDPFVLISCCFGSSSYLICSLLSFFFFLPVWTDMCSLTMGTTSPSSASSAPLNLPTWVAWRATCIRHTQVTTHTHAHKYIQSHLTAVPMTNKLFPGKKSSLLFIILHITMLCLI